MVEVDDGDRAAYHAAASIAANHLVALIGQVERVAATAGLAARRLRRPDCGRPPTTPLALGPAPALTGPAARGDWDTVERHRTALAAMAGPAASSPATTPWSALARRLSLDPAAAERRPAGHPSRRSPRPGRRGAGGVTDAVPGVNRRPPAPAWRVGGHRDARRVRRAPCDDGPALGPDGRAGADHGRPARRPPRR